MSINLPIVMPQCSIAFLPFYSFFQRQVGDIYIFYFHPIYYTPTIVLDIIKTFSGSPLCGYLVNFKLDWICLLC
ncbi:hypothetical protein I3843_16G032000 [Carya illinoinensis]|uniref:Uncharacterized protein n=1 Tax=Carya illinoinensis TaxID=32201 RepID=A0A922D481_CARIL|nr:hypothetical protein I3842_16G028900 [Carya illinoinensis]KAG7941285.1 hypothetical protein I3843_16G032000 [Carya illinoinensis]